MDSVKRGGRLCWRYKDGSQISKKLNDGLEMFQHKDSLERVQYPPYHTTSQCSFLLLFFEELLTHHTKRAAEFHTRNQLEKRGADSGEACRGS